MEVSMPLPIPRSPAITYNPELGGVYMFDQERFLRFGKGGFCPVTLGQVLHNRYRVLSLLGWGGYAMVWLAIDLSPE